MIHKTGSTKPSLPSHSIYHASAVHCLPRISSLCSLTRWA